MKYKIEFKYDPGGGEEYAREFAISLLEEEIILNFKKKKEYDENVEYLSSNDVIFLWGNKFKSQDKEISITKNTITTYILVISDDDDDGNGAWLIDKPRTYPIANYKYKSVNPKY